MEIITGVVRTTVNAAIMDYHNVQSESASNEIERIKEQLAEISKAFEGKQLTHRETVEAPGAMAPSGGAHEFPQDPDILQDIPQSPPERREATRGAPSSGRHTLKATCNPVLLQLFEQERAKWGFTLDQMLEHILYSYFKG